MPEGVRQYVDCDQNHQIAFLAEIRIGQCDPAESRRESRSGKGSVLSDIPIRSSAMVNAASWPSEAKWLWRCWRRSQLCS